MALGAKFERRQQQKPRQRRIGKYRLGKGGEPDLVAVEIAAECVAAGRLQDIFGPLKQLLMLHLLFTEAKQFPQPYSIVVPIPAGYLSHLNRDEFFVIAEQMNVTEGPNMVEGSLLTIVEEREVLGTQPGIGDERLARVEAAITEDRVHGPRYSLRHCHDRRIFQPSAERIIGHRRLLPPF